MKDGIHGKWNQEHMEQVTKLCKDYKPTQTNADRIRAMSDEELAEVLPIVFDCMCNSTDKCREAVVNHGECTKTTECALKWLQSEVEG